MISGCTLCGGFPLTPIYVNVSRKLPGLFGLKRRRASPMLSSVEFAGTFIVVMACEKSGSTGIFVIERLRKRDQ